jgi:peptide-methionine (S)-S-oxide reductase
MSKTLICLLLVVHILIPSAAVASPDKLEKATFAGGCFWCMEHLFEEMEGVVSVTSGYTGGDVENPTDYQVSQGNSGHAEAVEVLFDPRKVNYETLLSRYWRNIDPTVKNRQFCDKGSQYRTVIYYHDDRQQKQALSSLKQLQQNNSFEAPIHTEITPATRFTRAGNYHQDYYRNNPLRYRFYRYSCGRDKRLEELWGASGKTRSH